MAHPFRVDSKKLEAPKSWDLYIAIDIDVDVDSDIHTHIYIYLYIYTHIYRYTVGSRKLEYGGSFEGA